MKPIVQSWVCIIRMDVDAISKSRTEEPQPNQESKLSWTMEREYLKMYLMCSNLNKLHKIPPKDCQHKKTLVGFGSTSTRWYRASNREH